MISIIKRISVCIMMFFALFAMISCDSAKTRAKKIVALRFERKQLLDKLFQQYGGSEVAQALNANIQSGTTSENSTGSQLVQGLANITQNVDLTVFEEGIRTIGKGENLLMLTDKAKRFFSRDDVKKSARKICEIDLELDQLEGVKE